MITQLKTEHLFYNAAPGSSSDFEILNDICLEIHKQQITCLLEVSGNCSSALLQIIGGTLQAGKGEILFEGKNITAIPLPQRQQLIGYFKPTLLTESVANQRVWEYLAGCDKKSFPLNLFGRPDLPKEAVFRILATFQPETGSSPSGFVREVSDKEVLLLPLWAVLIRQPQLLLVDTLASFFPSAAIAILLTAIQDIHRQSGLSVLFSTRSPQQAFHLADRIFIVDNGHIIKTVENSDKPTENLVQLTCITEELRNRTSPCQALTALLEEQYI